MQTVTIYGSSDDLVEVEGDVPGCNEFNVIDAPLFIELGCGDVFRVEYTDRGVWTVDIYVHKSKLKYTKEHHGDGEDPQPYTDRVVATAKDIGWVEAWKAYPPTVEEMREKVARALTDDNDTDIDRHRVLSDADVRAIWDIVAAATRRAKA